MPQSVLTRKRSWTARFAVLAMVASLVAVALPAQAHSVPIDTSVSCPSGTPSAGFTDIGGFDAETQLAINCIFAFGITTGTSATTYSPSNPVTRWQMALFLVRQAADHGITIPAPSNQGYTDIGGLDTATQNAINQITQLGISKGTSTTTFSPFDNVTRWQMALFLHRLGISAGVTFTDAPGHNEFTDISTLTSETQVAINALADAHIALGVGGSLYAPTANVLRWQMALFLTRVLGADNIPAPAGIRVTVTPTAAVSQGAATARAYTATFRNLDGTPYTGAVGITLFAVTSGVVQYDGAPAPNAVIESTTDGLAGVGTALVEGFPGVDGQVSFVVRHTAGAQTVVPVAWEDLNNDNDPEITGNNAPTEPHGLGGNTTFAAAPAAECLAGAFAGVAVTLVDKAADRFEGGGCSFFYDANDLLLIEGTGTDLTGFEAALTVGDVVGGTYDPDTADQSTIDITTDNAAAVTVTSPAAATSTTAGTFTVAGTGAAAFLVSIYTDGNDNGLIDGADAKVAEGTISGDGSWSLVVPLQTGVANNFTANQRQFVPDAPGTTVDVPTITQGAVAGVTFSSTTAVAGAGTANTLDPGDVITIVFSGAIQNVGNGDTLTIIDADSTSTLTCGPAGNVTCAVGMTVVANDTLTLTITGTVSGPITNSLTFTAVNGFESANGQPISFSGDRTAGPGEF